MRNLFTEDFFKNVIGFATILCLAMGIVVIAGYMDDGTIPGTTQVAGSQQE